MPPLFPARMALQFMSYRNYRTAVVLLCVAVASGACTKAEAPEPPAAVASVQPEAKSPNGKSFFPRDIPAAKKAQLEVDLAAAKRAHGAAPNDADSIIWYGRRLGYLERFQEAIAVFGDGIAKHPDDSRLYRFRGHRYISVREFDKAIADLSRAAELIKGQADAPEPDGAPNALGIPTSTQHGNIYYHLALAYYLKADYAASLTAWDEALRIANNDDTRIAVNDWRYMTLRRQGRENDANALLKSVNKNLKIIENTAYFRRMLMYKGELPADSLLSPNESDPLQYVTQGYGVGNWYLANGDSTKAFAIFDKVTSSDYWAAFGFIAAEADLARRKSQQP
ncbi:MAG: hypothetical protein ABI120_14925 [Gemmatimonadaceae bacterium]